MASSEFDQSGAVGIVVDQRHAYSQFASKRNSLACSEVEFCERDGVVRAHDFERARTSGAGSRSGQRCKWRPCQAADWRITV